MSTPNTDPNIDALFQAESVEHLERMNQVLLQIEAGTAIIDNAIHDLFRAAHSLKGAARTVGRTRIEQLSHAIETVFDAIRSGQLSLSPSIADTLYDGLDSIQYLLDHADVDFDVAGVISNITAVVDENSDQSIALATTPVVTQHEPETIDIPPSAQAEESMRVALYKLDTMMLALSNLMMERMNIEQRVVDLRAARRMHQTWQRQWRRFHQYYIRLLREYDQNLGESQPWYPLLDFLHYTQRYMREMGHQLSDLETNMVENSLDLGSITDALQDNVRDIRLVPFDTLSNLLQRAVRDSARALNKQVGVQIFGGSIEFDKQVLEVLKDALLHILRNAVDHGIEPADVRQAAGKSADGLLLISLFQKGNTVHIIISDDGGGIDVDAVRNRVQALGLLSAESVAALNESEIYNMLMLPGFSTRTAVSTFSGRGVGLDVVRDTIERLQGRIAISSEVGRGTTIELIVPVSLSTQHCLLVRTHGETYAIPTATVLRILDYSPSAAFMVKGQPMLSFDDVVMPVLQLGDTLGRGRGGEENQLAIIVEILGRSYCIVVDDVIAEQMVLARPLPVELRDIPLLTGATLLADGEIVLILNMGEVVKQSRMQPQPTRLQSKSMVTTQPRRYTILVVDDSITTRTLQKNILEAAGFDVISATHGLEALDILASQAVDLVISDVEMPHLNGFELTEKIRQNSQLQELPVILVTSLDSAEHKSRGIRAGADAYIPKGVFDQNELLNTIKAIL